MSRLALVVLLAACGCGGDEDSTACANLIEYCPSGYTWSFYTSDEVSCVQAFSCVRNAYTGECRATLDQGTDCLAELTGPEGCDACDAVMESLTDSCPYPQGCF